MKPNSDLCEGFEGIEGVLRLALVYARARTSDNPGKIPSIPSIPSVAS
jgi:hypothetical protein